MTKFKELEVWQRAIDFNMKLIELMKELPKSELYSLQDQCKRASVSISSNIAEGSGRGSDKDFSRFLKIALSSAYELESQLIIVETSFKINTENLRVELTIIHKQLRSLIFAIKPKKQIVTKSQTGISPLKVSQNDRREF